MGATEDDARRRFAAARGEFGLTERTTDSDFYASPFGAIYSAYMERPQLGRLIGRAAWGGDSRPYYESMGAVSALAAGATVVDCPCGAGPALRALPADASLRYLAVDRSPSMLRRARSRAAARGLHGIEFIEADAGDLPLAFGSADLFLSYWGLHCFEDPPAALREAARCLKPGSRLVGATFVQGTESLRQRLLIRPGSGDFGKVATQEEIEAWLGEARFDLTATSRSGPMFFFEARLRS
jgi:SAM-dependent methyltransferase